MFSRRRFLQSSTLVALTPTIPTFLARAALGAARKQDAPILVVIQLDGGNDGINTVVPFKDEGYAANRQQLRIPTSQLIQLNDEVGLHPRLRSAGELFDDARLAIVQGVGYPNPSRSHFRSMAIWQSASFDTDDHDGPGWLGQALSGRKKVARHRGPDTIYVGTQELPVALRGRRSVSTTVADAGDLSLRLSELGHRAATQMPPEQTGDLRDFVRESVLQAYGTAHELSDSMRHARSQSAYPRSELASRLKLISQWIQAGTAARVFYTSQSGYDTHAVQLPTHADLLGEFSSSLKAFLDDLQQAGLAERVLVLAFSEFGRRVRENGSLGTDHGAAGPVFLAGAKVIAGLHGQTPSLTDLDRGDVKAAVDFRRVYATLLDDWLALPRPQHLAEFKSLPLVARS